MFSPTSRESYLVYCPISRESYLVFSPISRESYLVFSPTSKESYLVYCPISRESYLVFSPFSREPEQYLLSPHQHGTVPGVGHHRQHDAADVAPESIESGVGSSLPVSQAPCDAKAPAPGAGGQRQLTNTRLIIGLARHPAHTRCLSLD